MAESRSESLVAPLGAVAMTVSAALLALRPGTAQASGGSPVVTDVGMGGEGCSGVLGNLLEFDMFFEVQSPPCGGAAAFDVAFLAVVALIVISAIRFRHATARRRLDLARRMVEKGMEPHADLLGARQGNDLRRGLVLVFTGIGLVLASSFGGGEGLSPVGLIPGFIGIGYLVSHRFAHRDGGQS